MSATLKVTHKAIGAEVRRGTYDVVVDGERAGSVEMDHTIEPSSPSQYPLHPAIENRYAERTTMPAPGPDSPCSVPNAPSRGSLD